MPNDVNGNNPFSGGGFNADIPAATKASLDKMQKMLASMTASYSKIAKLSQSVLSSTTKQSRLFNDQLRVMNKLSNAESLRLRNMLESIRLQNSVNNSINNTGTSLIGFTTRLTAALAVMGKITSVVNRNIEARFQTFAINPNLLGQFGASSRSLELVNNLFKNSAVLRYGQNSGGIKNLTDRLSGFGQFGTGIASDFVGSLSASEKQRFFQGLNSGSVESAIQSVRNSSNVLRADELLNLIKGTNDPLIQSTKSLSETMEKLDSTILQLTETLANLLNKSGALDFINRNPLTSLGIGAGALLGGRAIGGLASRRGMLKAGLPGVSGGLSGFAGGVGGAARVLGPWGLAIAGLLAVDDLRPARQTLPPFNAETMRRMQGITPGLPTVAPLPALPLPALDRIQRQAVNRELLNDTLKELSATLINAEQSLNLSRMQTIQVDINKLPPDLQHLSDIQNRQIRALEDLRATYDATNTEGKIAIQELSGTISGLKTEIAMQGLRETELSLNRLGMSTEIERLNYELARWSPLGSIGAQTELNIFTNSIREQIDAINRLIPAVDTSTRAGQDYVTQLTIESKRLNLSLLEVNRDFLQSAISAAQSQAGNFESIIVTSERNTGIALKQNLFTPLPAMLGSTKPDAPRTQSVKFSAHPGLLNSVADLLERSAKDTAQAAKIIKEGDKFQTPSNRAQSQ